MTGSLQRADNASLALSARRSYELAISPEDALERLQTSSGAPVLTPAQAEHAAGNEPFIVLTGEGFTLYKPWQFRFTTPEGVSGEEFAVGPALVGRLVQTPRGSRLEVHVKRYAPVPAQRRRLQRAAIVSVLLSAMLLVLGGAHPVALGLIGVTLGGVLASVLFYRRQQRSQDVRELLAVVEGTFGPLELGAADEGPHRRDERGNG